MSRKSTCKLQRKYNYSHSLPFAGVRVHTPYINTHGKSCRLHSAQPLDVSHFSPRTPLLLLRYPCGCSQSFPLSSICCFPDFVTNVSLSITALIQQPKARITKSSPSMFVLSSLVAVLSPIALQCRRASSWGSCVVIPCIPWRFPRPS